MNRTGKIAALSLALTFWLALPARAQEQCGPLKLVNIIHMIPTLDGGGDIVPIIIGGEPRNFLLDTGAFLSQISRPLAKQLNLPIRQERQELYDAVGNISRDQTRLPELTLGAITAKNVAVMIAPALGTEATKGVDGMLGPDLLVQYDAELDFGNDTLNLFSPDHCPGHVVYWNAPAVASVPISLEQPRFSQDHRDTNILKEIQVTPAMLGARELSGFHIYVPVMLDGHQIKALLDTGATTTALRKDVAQQMFGLVMGSADTPVRGILNGEASLKIYSHLFKSLSFGPVSIANPRTAIIPNAMNRNVEPTPLIADRTKTERDLVNGPELIIGMDVLRRLHLYLAFQEGKMYVSPASPRLGAMEPYGKDFIAGVLARLDSILAASPDDAAALNDRCFWRGIAKAELDGALADCDKSLTLEPGTAATLDSRAFVLYQQGKYPEALAAYDAALKADPAQAPSLLMRGIVKQRLGDAAGAETDIAAARAGDPNIEAEFKRIGIATPPA